MNRAEAEHILAPIILGFEVAKERAAELLRQAQAQTLDRARLHELARHESDIEQAMAFVRARAKGWNLDGLMVAVESGRSVATWPSVMPGSDFADRTIAAWRESRAGTEPAPNVAPLQRPA